MELQEKYDELKIELEKFKDDYEQFIQIAAHDLDSPLRKLLTFSDRLKAKLQNADNEDAKIYLTRINNLVEQMRSIVDSLYHLSMINEEKSPIENCDLNKIVTKVLDGFDEEIREKNIAVEKTDLSNVRGNQNQLSLLFKNIFDNAFKFSRKDVPLKINITAFILTEEQKNSFGLPPKISYQNISITDNGIGFNHDQSENIFKPFVRLHGKSEFPGSGLGLAICKKIVEKHKGIIYAEATENSGACFVLILPQ